MTTEAGGAFGRARGAARWSAVQAGRAALSTKGSWVLLWAGSQAKPRFWDFGDWASLWADSSRQKVDFSPEPLARRLRFRVKGCLPGWCWETCEKRSGLEATSEAPPPKVPPAASLRLLRARMAAKPRLGVGATGTRWAERPVCRGLGRPPRAELWSSTVRQTRNVRHVAPNFEFPSHHVNKAKRNR